MRSKSTAPTAPHLGFGLGLRTAHYEAILRTRPSVDWFEVLTENYLIAGGKPLHYLDRICDEYPCVMHGVSLSIGSTDPIDRAYLKEVKALAKRTNPRWISDHLCWTGVASVNTHDLLPLPYTEEALKHVSARVREVQDFLGRRILLENVSSYLGYKESTMSEWDFLAALTHEADCLLLLDINNIYVSAFNHRFDAEEYLLAIPAERVQQIHLAGHANCGEYIIDTHDAEIVDPVWALYEKAVNRFGRISTMIERDDHIPPLSDLVTELEIARGVTCKALERVTA